MMGYDDLEGVIYGVNIDAGDDPVSFQLWSFVWENYKGSNQYGTSAEVSHRL